MGKASNFFMPKETLSDKGPGGGGWIHFNKYLQVTKKPQPGQLRAMCGARAASLQWVIATMVALVTLQIGSQRKERRKLRVCHQFPRSPIPAKSRPCTLA